MFLQRKALYNLIQLKLIQLESHDLNGAPLEPWQTQNYRHYTTEELLMGLHKLSIHFELGDFETYSKSYDTPEEMSEALTKEMDPLDADKVYLHIFELWRRLFPERQSLSLFCDELDNQIVKYEKDKVFCPEEIQDAVAYLQNILDKNVDEGATAEQAFQLIQTFCANELEGFIYSYVLDLINEENTSYALELLEGFYRYVANKLWFDYLRVRVEIVKDPEEGYEHLEKLLFKVKDHSDIELYFEILAFLATGGHHTLFSQVANSMVHLLQTEEDFQDFGRMCLEHYLYLELKEPAYGIQTLLQENKDKELSQSLLPSDPRLFELKRILKREYKIKSL